MKSRFRALAGVSCVSLALVLSGCGSGSEGPRTPTALAANATAVPRAQVTEAPPSDASVVEITIEGDSVTPRGESREVKRTQPVVFQITASEPGQLHVHSSPEQVIDYPAGESSLTTSFDIPGIVDVEDHALGEAIIQFEVN